MDFEVKQAISKQIETNNKLLEIIKSNEKKIRSLKIIFAIEGAIVLIEYILLYI
jgi:hypothetical protein